MDVQTDVEVSWCGTVHEQDVRRHPRPSEVFVSFSLGCSTATLRLLLLPVSLPPNEAATGTAQHLPMLRLRLWELPLLPHLFALVLR